MATSIKFTPVDVELAAIGTLKDDKIEFKYMLPEETGVFIVTVDSHVAYVHGGDHQTTKATAAYYTAGRVSKSIPEYVRTQKAVDALKAGKRLGVYVAHPHGNVTAKQLANYWRNNFECLWA
jgi:hypothetical protein